MFGSHVAAATQRCSRRKIFDHILPYPVPPPGRRTRRLFCSRSRTGRAALCITASVEKRRRIAGTSWRVTRVLIPRPPHQDGKAWSPVHGRWTAVRDAGVDELNRPLRALSAAGNPVRLNGWGAGWPLVRHAADR